MGNQQNSYAYNIDNAQEELENITWFFKEHPVEKKMYKLWYEADEPFKKTKKHQEFIPSFEEISEEMDSLLNQSKNSKHSEDYWDDNYENYKNTKNPIIQYYKLCILHYSFMNVIIRKLYNKKILENIQSNKQLKKN